MFFFSNKVTVDKRNKKKISIVEKHTRNVSLQAHRPITAIAPAPKYKAPKYNTFNRVRRE